MTTYALIDEYSGFIWGVMDAPDPIAACRAVDADCHEYNRNYKDIGGGRFDGRSGYLAYEVPDGYTVNDGQNQDSIDRIAAFPLVARIVIR